MYSQKSQPHAQIKDVLEAHEKEDTRTNMDWSSSNNQLFQHAIDVLACIICMAWHAPIQFLSFPSPSRSMWNTGPAN